MESSPKRRVGRKVSEKHSFRFIDKINKVQEIDVYDNEKRLILVGNDSNRRLKHIINFDKCSIELRDDPVNQVINEEDVEIYLKESLNCKKTKKYLKYKAYGVFGIYQFYKLTYICLIRDIKKVATFLDSPINEIKEVDLFAIQSKKFYKKILGKKDVNIERTYKKSFRSYKIYKYFYFSYDYDLTTNIQRQRKDIALKGSKQDLFTKKFTWNGDLALFNKVFKYHEWIVPIIHGYVGTFTIDEIEGEYTLISRRSRFSTGARYLKRGINKFGHPANEVESEHILCNKNPLSSSYIKISSFIQMRGSIPLIWKNTKITSLKPKFEYDEEKNKDYISSFLHLDEVQRRYDAESICFFNLIRQQEGKNNESLIGKGFREFFTAASTSKDKVIKDEEEEGIEIIEMEEAKTLEHSEEDSGKLANSKTTDSSEEEKESKEDSGKIQDDYDLCFFGKGDGLDLSPRKARTMTFDDIMMQAMKESKSLSIKTKSEEELPYNTVYLEKGGKTTNLRIPDLKFIEFDFLAYKKLEGRNFLHDILKMYSNGFCDNSESYSFDETNTSRPVENLQKGIVRVNCIDCLDRTNYAMTFIAACALYRQIGELYNSKDASKGITEKEFKFFQDEIMIKPKPEDGEMDVYPCVRGNIMVKLSKIYSENGDAISKQYCGSKAMHGTSMKMDKKGEVVVDSRNDNGVIFTKRFFNNYLGKDMKKQSVLCLITGHFKFKEIGVHPWKIDFHALDVNFDSTMHHKNEFEYGSIFSQDKHKTREVELEEMFSNL